MNRKRIEPGIGESSERRLGPEPMVAPPRRASGWSDLPPVIKLASIAIVFASGVFVADRVYDRYKEHLAVQEAIAFLERMEADLAASARQAEAHQTQQREARTRSAQGRWLHQNCQDWRRSFGDSQLPTAREEMVRYCRAYERYLETGQVAAEFRMPSSR